MHLAVQILEFWEKILPTFCCIALWSVRFSSCIFLDLTFNKIIDFHLLMKHMLWFNKMFQQDSFKSICLAIRVILMGQNFSEFVILYECSVI